LLGKDIFLEFPIRGGGGFELFRPKRYDRGSRACFFRLMNNGTQPMTIVPRSSELNRPGKRAKRIETHKGETPLAYALRIMRDPEVDYTRRDKMAIAALPYCHPRVAEHRITEKEIRARQAETLLKASAWERDLLPQ
jgi:hypothetical protein